MSETIQDIIKDHLVENKFDGLATEDCGCSVSDLMPCCAPEINCMPAFKYETQKGAFYSARKNLSEEQILIIADELL